MKRIGLAVLALFVLAGRGAKAQQGCCQFTCSDRSVGAVITAATADDCETACDAFCLKTSSSCLSSGVSECPEGEILSSCGVFQYTCATPSPTPTTTPTPTATPTPTPHNLHDNDPCNDSRQCTSALCNGGVCAERNPAPAVSNHTAAFIGAALLLAGLWSVRRLARRG